MLMLSEMRRVKPVQSSRNGDGLMPNQMEDRVWEDAIMLN